MAGCSRCETAPLRTRTVWRPVTNLTGRRTDYGTIDRLRVRRAITRDVSWAVRVAVSLVVPLVIAILWNGVVALVVGLLMVGATLSREIAPTVGPRAHEVEARLAEQLAELRILKADHAIDHATHNPFNNAAYVLSVYRPTSSQAQTSLEDLRRSLDSVVQRLGLTESQRDAIGDEQGRLPRLVGGLAVPDQEETTMKLYGDPVNVPVWVRWHELRDALSAVGRVLDDVRQLHSAEIEWLVLSFTLFARALLLVLTPAVGALTFGVVPDLPDSSSATTALWMGAGAWAIATAFAAPALATLVMQASQRGARVRRLLLVVELPLSCALALVVPAWTAVAFSAGWTNWWQRVARQGGDRKEIPDFSWSKLSIWILVVAGTQVAGLLGVDTPLSAWQVAVEVGWTMIVIAVIGGSYGAMLPVSAGMLISVVARGARDERRAAEDVTAVIHEVAEKMARAADDLALHEAGGQGADAAEVLRRSTRQLLSPERRELRRRQPRSLVPLVYLGLAEGGYEMWAGDPRALGNRSRAEREGEPSPVIVQRPSFQPSQAAFDDIRLSRRDASTLRRLLKACVVEARVHGVRRVETVVGLAGDRVEIRIANEPARRAQHEGRGRGSKLIATLAQRLPGGRETFRGLTDRSFIGKRGSLQLFGVGFSFETTPE